MICPDCEGSYLDSADYYYSCHRCHGLGKLDWIEMIVGKDNPWASSSFSSTSSTTRKRRI